MLANIFDSQFCYFDQSILFILLLFFSTTTPHSPRNPRIQTVFLSTSGIQECSLGFESFSVTLCDLWRPWNLLEAFWGPFSPFNWCRFFAPILSFPHLVFESESSYSQSQNETGTERLIDRFRFLFHFAQTTSERGRSEILFVFSPLYRLKSRLSIYCY